MHTHPAISIRITTQAYNSIHQETQTIPGSESAGKFELSDMHVRIEYIAMCVGLSSKAALHTSHYRCRQTHSKHVQFIAQWIKPGTTGTARQGRAGQGRASDKLTDHCNT